MNKSFLSSKTVSSPGSPIYENREETKTNEANEKRIPVGLQ